MQCLRCFYFVYNTALTTLFQERMQKSVDCLFNYTVSRKNAKVSRLFNYTVSRKNAKVSRLFV